MPVPETLSVIVPAFNEEGGLARFYETLRHVFEGLDLQGEFVFVDDGSTDGTVDVLARLADADDRVRVVSLSRNFGKEIAVTAGLEACRGDAAIIVDADLQHPLEKIPEFVAKWRAGAEVVVGVRRANASEPWWRRAASLAYYRLMSAVSETPVTPYATDFRLLDRQVIDEFRRFTEHGRLTRALIDWLGFRRDTVEFEAAARTAGASKFGFWRLLRLALNGFVSHSLLPLKLAGYLGIAIVLVSGPLGLFILVEKYFLGDPLHYAFSGPAILAVILMFLVGVILCCLGLIALYIASIHAEVTNRPLYAVRRRAGRRS